MQIVATRALLISMVEDIYDDLERDEIFFWNFYYFGCHLLA